MPSTRLRQRRCLFLASPSVPELALHELDGLGERLYTVSTFAELDDYDRDLVRRCVIEISSAGQPAIGLASSGDWRAIDQAMEAEDEDALEVALDSVGPAEDGFGPAPLSDSPEPGALSAGDWQVTASLVAEVLGDFMARSFRDLGERGVELPTRLRETAEQFGYGTIFHPVWLEQEGRALAKFLTSLEA